MILNSAPINSAPINGSGQQDAVDVELAFIQNVVTDFGNVKLSFQQIVFASGDVLLGFDQSVNYPIGDASLFFAQLISDTGDAGIIFQQNVFTPASIADSWVGWDVSVFIDGIDKSADLIGQMTIDAEISSARTAVFSILLSGVVQA